jgi:hypothetical protein
MTMPQAPFDIVIPLFQPRWNTRAVLEGLTQHYAPRCIHIIAPAATAKTLAAISQNWATAALQIHPEETFFQPLGLTKDTICAELDLGESLYNPGWFYQQLLKLGAFEGIPELSPWYLVWDSDLLPVQAWPVLEGEAEAQKHVFALLQHNGWGNATIVSRWSHWISTVLGVTPLTDPEGTFIPHHMWFKQTHLRSFAARVNQYFESDDHWLRLMMRSANPFGTFSEYWAYVSWVAATAPADLAFHPYDRYGATTERFFDDGTGRFSAALKEFLGESAFTPGEALSPPYADIEGFIQAQYGAAALPSSLSFESSPRHLKKDGKTMHIEERRSRWNPRPSEPAAMV